MASRSSVHFITLCISGDVENLFAVLIQKNNTVAELKEVIKRKTLIPVDEQSLYFQEQLIQDECVLSSYSGLGDGGIVYLCRRPLTLNVHSLLSDPPSELRLTVGHEVKRFSVSSLMSIICDRLGESQANTQCILMCNGELLEEWQTLGEYPNVHSGSKIIVQKAPVPVCVEDHQVTFKLYTPQGTSMNFLTQRLSYKSGTTPVQLKCGAYILRSELEKAEQYKKLQYKYGYLSKDEAVCSSTNLIKRGWILDVQRLDGTKVPVSVVEKKNMPIVKLKECIEECTGVPTHRQRLTMGSTILEDWDHEDRMMFIGDYPSIHDGSLLYLVQLEGGTDCQ